MKLNKKQLLKVRVLPDSGREEVIRKEDKIVIKVKEKAVHGKANKKVFKILSLIFPGKRIELVKGFKSKNKIFKIYEK